MIVVSQNNTIFRFPSLVWGMYTLHQQKNFFCLCSIFACRLILYLYVCAVDNSEISGFCESKIRAVRAVKHTISVHTISEYICLLFLFRKYQTKRWKLEEKHLSIDLYIYKIYKIAKTAKLSKNILVLFENGKLKGKNYKLLSKNTLKVIY